MEQLRRLGRDRSSFEFLYTAANLLGGWFVFTARIRGSGFPPGSEIQCRVGHRGLSILLLPPRPPGDEADDCARRHVKLTLLRQNYGNFPKRATSPAQLCDQFTVWFQARPRWLLWKLSENFSKFLIHR
jgi:hypothetical protein